MHLVTFPFPSTLILVLKKPAHKAALLSAYIHVLVLTTFTRDRPRINPELLLVSYTDIPRPPVSAGNSPKPNSTSLGNSRNDTDDNSWPAMIEAVQYHHDSHVSKTLRTLIFASQNYGDKAIGAFHRDSGVETHNGTGKMDETIFVRAAGLVMDNLRWVNYGQKAHTPSRLRDPPDSFQLAKELNHPDGLRRCRASGTFVGILRGRGF
jgi:hypothetical protein